MKKSRQRKPCEHCGNVHNKVKNAPFGCNKAKSVKTKTLTSSTSTKNPKLAPPSTSSSSSDDEESAQGEIFVPNSDDSVSRDSSAWEGSKDAESDEESDHSTHRRTNIINEYINELSESEGDSSASFHDDSSYESSVEDDLMPDLFEDTDDDEEEKDEDPDSDEDEEPTWTEEELAGPSTGNSRSTPQLFRSSHHYTHQGPATYPLEQKNPIDFLNLYMYCSIIDDFVTNTNICGAKLFPPPKKLLRALIRALGSLLIEPKFIDYLESCCIWG